MGKYRFAGEVQEAMEKARVPFAVYQRVDGRIRTIVLSAGLLDLYGYDNSVKAYKDADTDLYQKMHPDDRVRCAEAAERFASDTTGEARYDVIFRSLNKTRDGYDIIHATGEHIETENGERLAYVWYANEGVYTEGTDPKGFRLTTALQRALHEESIIKTTKYDNLTGLPSMTHFFETVSSRKSKSGLAMLFLDLCRMKYFNHTYGFAEGDRLLKAFSKLLVRYFGKENSSRLGQDHFAVLAEECLLKDKLSEFFEEMRWINGGLTLPVHIGVFAEMPDDIGAGSACDRAKLACDSINNVYSSSYCYFDDSMSEAVEKKQYVIANLDKALAGRWIKVYYQPIIRAINGRVSDEEALARWIDPVRGFLSPADFIPALEDSGLIYKLDLYVLDRVLEKLHTMRDAGLHLVPQSINLSRSDFDACDIVEEIRHRVDESGFSRNLITIEITESVIGSDFEFMKDKVARFRELGFSVWMDDFGSGYSSLDVLQSIKFDLIKFDMRFLQNFDEGNSGKIILNQLMKMVNSLGIDAVCEGVETESQMMFLRETGCTKLQGFYYERPIPVERILERYENGVQIGFENPDEAEYFETVGRVNLHDLSVMNSDIGSEYNNYFEMAPMAVIEMNGDKIRVARSNRSYRDFIRRYFKKSAIYYSDVPLNEMPILSGIIREAEENGGRTYFDVVLPDNSLAHYFVRRLAVNPVNGTVATIIIVLSITDPAQGVDYANVARALAADYTNLFYVDLETEHFIEYRSGAGTEDLVADRHGDDFFAQSRADARTVLYREDQKAFIKAFTKENIVGILNVQGTFTLNYRMMIDGEPTYVTMKAMKMHGSDRFIIIGVSNVDAQMKQNELMQRVQRDRVVYNRVMALSGNYICMYTVDPVTEKYSRYNASKDYEDYGLSKEGSHFFKNAYGDADKVLVPEDISEYRKAFTKENVLKEIAEKGIFTLQYRIIMNGEQKTARLKAALVNEEDGDKLIIGVTL